MKKILQEWNNFLKEQNVFSQWNGFPVIGWWEDNDPLTLYHGTHERNLDGILKDGIYAPTTGYTAGKVSLALEPNTGWGYASMSGTGGETAFRKAGAAAKHTPGNERIVFILQLPLSMVKENMLAARGNIKAYRNKLTDRQLYEKWKTEHGGENYDHSKYDQEYYALTELRLPEHVPAKYIIGVMKK